MMGEEPRRRTGGRKASQGLEIIPGEASVAAVRCRLGLTPIGRSHCAGDRPVFES